MVNKKRAKKGPKVQPRPKAQPRPRKPNPSYSAPSATIQQCVASFAKAVANPFADHHDVCLPIGEVLPSVKVRAWCRGTMSIGTGGVGFVLGRRATSSDTFSVSATDSSYAGDQSLEFQSSGAGIVTVTASGSLATDTELAISKVASAKPVLAALRIRYTGSEFVRSGQIFTWVDREDFNVIDMKPSLVLSKREAQVFPNNRQWITIKFVSSKPSSHVFKNTSRPDDIEGNTSILNAFPMVIGVIGASGTPFEWEFVNYFELRKNTLSSLAQLTDTATPQGEAFIDRVIAAASTAHQTVEKMEMRSPGLFWDAIGAVGSAAGRAFNAMAPQGGIGGTGAGGLLRLEL